MSVKDIILLSYLVKGGSQSMVKSTNHPFSQNWRSKISRAVKWSLKYFRIVRYSKTIWTVFEKNQNLIKTTENIVENIGDRVDKTVLLRRPFIKALKGNPEWIQVIWSSHNLDHIKYIKKNYRLWNESFFKKKKKTNQRTTNKKDSHSPKMDWNKESKMFKIKDQSLSWKFLLTGKGCQRWDSVLSTQALSLNKDSVCR